MRDRVPEHGFYDRVARVGSLGALDLVCQFYSLSLSLFLCLVFVNIDTMLSSLVE